MTRSIARLTRIALPALLGAALIACGGAAGPRPGEPSATASPWLYCTTNPCRPLALSALPTPPALGVDPAEAAACDESRPGAGDGVLLWHTDWDPQTHQGICVQQSEAEQLVGK